MIRINKDTRIKPNHRSWVVERRRVTQKGEDVWEAKAHCMRLQGAVAEILDHSYFAEAQKEELIEVRELLEPGKVLKTMEGIVQLIAYTKLGLLFAWKTFEIELEGKTPGLDELTPAQLERIRQDLKDDREVVQVLNAWDALQDWRLE